MEFSVNASVTIGDGSVVQHRNRLCPTIVDLLLIKFGSSKLILRRSSTSNYSRSAKQRLFTDDWIASWHKVLFMNALDTVDIV